MPTTTAPATPLDLLDDAAATLDQLAARTRHVDDAALLAHLLAGLRELRAAAGVAYDTTEQALIAALGELRSLEVDGLGVIERKRRTKRTAWRHDELLPLVVALALDERTVDPDTGEYEREADAVARVMRECISLGPGKVTALRARGVQPDEYCDEQPDAASIVLPPRKPA